MPEIVVDAQLPPWLDIEDKKGDSLLLGNGFSVNIWPKFGYKSLYDLARSGDIDSPLDANSIALFEKLATSNFEDVLKILFHASLVDDQLGSPSKEKINALYTSTKNGLASAVNFAHVPSGFQSLTRINQALRSFQNIFTTNYDLIPYWAIMHEETWRFRDYFWGQDTTFDPTNTQVGNDKSVVCYLHGAIHLVELPDGRTKKLTANALATLSDLFDLEHPEHFPLFISEGSFKDKLARIKRNDYLRFAFERLQSVDGSLVVMGHSLHKDYDQHLINALRDGKLSSIAIGIWPNQAAEDIVVLKSRVLAELKGKAVYFFDSTTHALGKQDLKHEV